MVMSLRLDVAMVDRDCGLAVELVRGFDQEVDHPGHFTHDRQQLRDRNAGEVIGCQPVESISERAFGQLHADDQQVVGRPRTEVSQEIGMTNRAKMRRLSSSRPPILQASRTSLSATGRPPGPSAHQTSPAPPHPHARSDDSRARARPPADQDRRPHESARSMPWSASKILPRLIAAWIKITPTDQCGMQTKLHVLAKHRCGCDRSRTTRPIGWYARQAIAQRLIQQWLPRITRGYCQN